MKTILLSNHYEGKPVQILEDAVGGDFILKVLKSVSQTELLESICEADYLISSGRLKIDSTVIDRADNLCMIQRTGVGVDHIDLQCLKDAGIPLYVNAGVNANSVAEYTIMLMLSVLKRSYAVNCQMRNGIWKKQETALNTHELKGRIIGIVGMGNIGRRVAQMLSVFGVKIIYASRRRLSQEEEKALNASHVELEELLEQADIVTLHCPYNAADGYLIAEKEIARMKDGAILINTARGKLVKQNVVAHALATGKLAGVGIDVFEEEPLQGISEYAAFESAVLSPHIAGLPFETFVNMMKMAVDNIRAFDRGDKESIASSLYMI